MACSRLSSYSPDTAAVSTTQSSESYCTCIVRNTHIRHYWTLNTLNSVLVLMYVVLPRRVLVYVLHYLCLGYMHLSSHTCTRAHTQTHTHTHTPHTHLYVGSEECSHTASHCGRAQEETLLWTQPPTFSCMLQGKGPNSALISSNLEWNDSYISVHRTYRSPNRCALYISSNLLTSPPPHYYNYAHLACPVCLYLVRIVLVTSSCYVVLYPLIHIILLTVMDHIDHIDVMNVCT